MRAATGIKVDRRKPHAELRPHVVGAGEAARSPEAQGRNRTPAKLRVKSPSNAKPISRKRQTVDTGDATREVGCVDTRCWNTTARKQPQAADQT